MARAGNNPPKAQIATELSRELTLFQLTMMGVGMMIGAGVFLGIGNAIGIAGPGGLILTFTLNTLLALIAAMAYAELSSAVPKAGGAYNFARIAFGRGPSFLGGWIQWFASAVAGSAYALVFSVYTLGFLDQLGLLGWLPVPLAVAEKIVAVAVILAFVYVNYRGVSETGKAGALLALGQTCILGVIGVAGVAGLRRLCGAVAGLVAYLPGLFWLSSVTVGGWIGLALYVSAYLVSAGLLVRLFHRRFRRAWPLLAAMAWVGLELVRGRFATGFPYLLYGYTQHRFIALIQLAALTGVYGVSFVLVFLNAALACVVLEISKGRPDSRSSGRKWALLAASVAIAAVGLCALGGGAVAARVSMRQGPVVGVVQQNIPRVVSELVPPADIIEAGARVRELREALGPQMFDMVKESTEEYRKLDAYDAKVYGRIRDEIEKAARLSELLQGQGLRLLVWPETTVSVPLNIAPNLNPDERSRDVQQFTLRTLRRLGESMDCYMLVGAPTLFALSAGYVEHVRYGTTVKDFGNSALMFTPQGEFAGRYDKMHLVPFGEYVPLRQYLPFLQKFTPMTRSITPGTEAVIFTLPTRQGQVVRFGALICYEDVVPELVRLFRLKGAQFLVNLTDEGWYRPAGELRQHAAMAVFRAVETRTTVVRAANTGISCFINPRGEVYALVQKAEGGRTHIRNVEGALSAPIQLCDQLTPYTRYGDVFAWACLVLAVALPMVRRFSPSVHRGTRRPTQP